MTKLLFCLGTRPEAIKLAPLILEARRNNFEAEVLYTGQHKDLVKPILELFNISPDYSLIANNSSLNKLTSNNILKISEVVEQSKPDYVLVQGDTNSAFCGALSAFHSKVPVIHIEAGLRTGNIYSPHPEEGYRKMISNISSIHFCPNENDLKNLEKEDIVDDCYVVGNTVIDSLNHIKDSICPRKKTVNTILITIHRRENRGDTLKNICKNIKHIASMTKANITFVCHPNPEIQKIITKRLLGVDNIDIQNSLKYDSFISLLANSSLVITDSGGIQEEANHLGIPTFVIRDYTERHFQTKNLVNVNGWDLRDKTELFFEGKMDITQDHKQIENASKNIIKILNEQII